MKLIAYLQATGETQAHFAQRTGLSIGLVSLLCAHKTWLSRKTALAIRRATDGSVTPDDFLTELSEAS
jgi:3,4-dihydroxy 2-butanone 4-phosphate synthase/GTP cyclohydrolase II